MSSSAADAIRKAAEHGAYYMSNDTYGPAGYKSTLGGYAKIGDVVIDDFRLSEEMHEILKFPVSSVWENIDRSKPSENAVSGTIYKVLMDTAFYMKPVAFAKVVTLSIALLSADGEATLAKLSDDAPGFMKGTVFEKKATGKINVTAVKIIGVLLLQAQFEATRDFTFAEERQLPIFWEKFRMVEYLRTCSDPNKAFFEEIGKLLINKEGLHQFFSDKVKIKMEMSHYLLEELPYLFVRLFNIEEKCSKKTRDDIMFELTLYFDKDEFG